jgi:hypothetical protein
MAAIGLQTKARRAGKRLRPPTVKVRRSASDDTSTIVEVTAPDGTGLLIEFGTHRDHTGLRVVPYRADVNVAIHLRDHAKACALIQSPALDMKCDCGSEVVRVGPETPWRWRKTSREPRR